MIRDIPNVGFGVGFGIFLKFRFVRGFGFDFFPKIRFGFGLIEKIRFGFGFEFGIFKKLDSDSAFSKN